MMFLRNSINKILCRVVVFWAMVGLFFGQALLNAVSSKSFFMPRATGSDAVLTQAGFHNFIREHEPAERFFLSATGFYQESTNSKDLAKYFLPAGKSQLVIKGAFAAGPAP